MPGKVNMIGQRYYRLLVLKQVESYFDGKRNRLRYLCKCDCGKEKILRAGDIRSGDSKSCGCLRIELLEIDLRKERFGKLVVKEKTNRRGKSTSTFWECRCDCGRNHIVSAQHLREGFVTSCGCLHDRSEEEELKLAKQIFFKNILKNGSCWEWQGCKALGYGVMWFQKKTIKSHRFSYLIHKGPLYDGKYICHKCDNKKCVNPDHLYQGTAKENARDAIERGQLPTKLTEENVLKILKSNAKDADIAIEYGVNINTIRRIRTRESWKHVDMH